MERNMKTLKALHMNSVRDLNLRTSLKMIHESGFGGVELNVIRLRNFLSAGYSYTDIKDLLAECNLVPICINDIFGVESDKPEEQKRVFSEMEYFAPLAQAIGCKTLQVCPLEGLNMLSWPEARRIIAENIGRLAQIGEPYGVRIQIEPVVWGQINSLSRCLEVIDEIGSDNTGVSVDLWHFHAGRATTPDDVAKLDKDLICNIHFCDGKAPGPNESWDEELQRAFYPGQGDIPLREYADAIKATGYDGPWSAELISRKHWEDDSREVLRRLYVDLCDYAD